MRKESERERERERERQTWTLCWPLDCMCLCSFHRLWKLPSPRWCGPCSLWFSCIGLPNYTECATCTAFTKSSPFCVTSGVGTRSNFVAWVWFWIVIIKQFWLSMKSVKVWSTIFYFFLVFWLFTPPVLFEYFVSFLLNCFKIHLAS